MGIPFGPRPFTVAALLALGLSGAAAGGGCASPAEDYRADPALEKQIQERIAALEFLRGADLVSNIEYLGAMIREPAVPFLADALENHASARVRAGAAQALGKSQDQRAIPALRKAAASDPVPGVRYTAAFSLCRYRDPAGVPVLFEALKSDDVEHRRDANEKLKWLTKIDYGFDPLGEPGERRAAVERWEAWYREQGPERVAMSLVPPERR